jgi:hypothetical protein
VSFAAADSKREPAGYPRGSILFGLLVWFVVAIDLIRYIRIDLLLSSEASWAAARLLLTLLVIGVSTGAGVLAAGGFFLWSRTSSSTEALEPLPFGRKAVGLMALAALAFGVLARFAWLDSVPPTIWTDEILPVLPSLALSGHLRDFADPIRMLPTDGGAFAMGGVFYLEGCRLLLRSLGTTLFSIRLPAALSGVLSIVTAMLLARALLPRGGGALAGCVLAGLRWQLILARYAWNVLALVPVVDVATLLLVRARRRSSLAASAAGGLVAGLGAYLYLGAWIVAVALAGFLLWPQVRLALRSRLALALVFGLGFFVAASPIFLFARNRPAPYFGRASNQSLILDFRRTKSWMPPFSVLADSFQAPWLIPDPVSRQDLPVSRLGWILGIPVAVALARAVRSPRQEVAALLLSHATVAVAASLRWGFPGHPNGYRFLYLTTVTAVAAAAGVLWLVQRAARPARRAAALAAVGLLSVSAFLGARDALLRWGSSRETFDAYLGQSTLVGRAALRWQRYGRVDLDSRLYFSRSVVEVVRRFELDPDRRRAGQPLFPSRPTAERSLRCFRITERSVAPRQGERRVEVIRDAWGRDHAVVMASRCPPL